MLAKNVNKFISNLSSKKALKEQNKYLLMGFLDMFIIVWNVLF